MLTRSKTHFFQKGLKMNEATKVVPCFTILIVSLSITVFGESTTTKENKVVGSLDNSHINIKATSNIDYSVAPFRSYFKKSGQKFDYAKLYEILNKADKYFIDNDFKNSLIEYNRALKTPPMDIDLSASLYNGSYKKYCDTAVLHLQDMLNSNFLDKGMVYDCLGDFCAKQGNLDLAFKHYKAAKKLKPELVDPHLRIAMHYVYQEEFEKAIMLLRDIVKNNPSDITAWSFLSFAAFSLDLKEESVKASSKVLELDPNNIEAIRSHVFISFFDKSLDVNFAIKNLNLVISNDPKDIEALKIRAFCYFVKKDYDAAIADINSALKVDPDNSFCLKKRAELLFKFKGESEKPLVDLSLALEIENKDKETDEVLVCEIHDLLSIIYSKLGNEKKSLFHTKMSELIKNRSSQDKTDSPEIELPDFLK
jgi:cytochrome c-type biogenesis protein CcmH/NrfG